MPNYQPGVPTGLVPLNQDYLNLQGNFTSLNTQFLVDHVPLTNTDITIPNGYHKVVHLVPFSTTVTNAPNNQPVVAPAATPGFGEIFDAQIYDGINTDTALYFQSGGGRLTQLTRNIQPVPNPAGYTFLPGGLIMQWGTGASGTAVPFYAGAPFATLFSLQITPFTVGAPLQNVTNGPQAYSVSNAGFNVGDKPAGDPFVYYWLAIGI